MLSLSALLLWGSPALSLLIEDIRATNESVPRIERFDDWMISCFGAGADARCQMEPAVSEARSLFAVIVPGAGDPAPGAVTPVLILRTPLSVLLPAGVELSVDGSSLGRLAYQTCEAQGCVAPLPVSGRIDAAFRRGRSLEIRFTDRNRQENRQAISLIGFTAAMRALSDLPANPLASE